MATLHMDVETVRSTQSKMTQEQQQMTTELQNVTNSVNSTVGSAWIGNSATEFQQQYDGLRSNITQQLERLAELAQQLQQEISQWEEMAARMG